MPELIMGILTIVLGSIFIGSVTQIDNYIVYFIGIFLLCFGSSFASDRMRNSEWLQ